MPVAMLLMILTGALAGASAMVMQDASWVRVGLGYVLGGWAGLALVILASLRPTLADPD